MTYYYYSALFGAASRPNGGHLVLVDSADVERRQQGYTHYIYI